MLASCNQQVIVTMVTSALKLHTNIHIFLECALQASSSRVGGGGGGVLQCNQHSVVMITMVMSAPLFTVYAPAACNATDVCTWRTR